MIIAESFLFFLSKILKGNLNDKQTKKQISIQNVGENYE